MVHLINIGVSAALIAFAACLSGRYPSAAGFFVALPVATLLVLPMAHVEHDDAAQLQKFALSILIAVPVVMLFLVPLLVAHRYGLSFWLSYALAALWLVPGYFLHRYLVWFVA
jgi:hypothetical protein